MSPTARRSGPTGIMARMVRAIPPALFVLAASAFAAEGLVRLTDPLDEPEHYCVDVPGWGRRTNLDAPLTAHTCKPGAADELFVADHPESGRLYMHAYDRCVSASASEEGAKLFIRRCSSSALQRFSFESDGRIRLAGSDLCLTVAGGKGEPTGGPSHLRRDLSLERCGTDAHPRSSWTLPAAD